MSKENVGRAYDKRKEVEGMINDIKRGEIVLVDLSGALYSEQGSSRPALVVQNNMGNQFSPTTIIVPMTSKIKNNLPTHILIESNEYTGLKEESTAMCEQIRTIDKRRIIKKIGKVDDVTLSQVFNAYKASFGEL